MKNDIEPNNDYFMDDSKPIDKQTFFIEPEWEIAAEINSDLKAEAIKLLKDGVSPRKVAIHCGITIDKIKQV